jgi:GT2 family glycosyltransferase
VTSLRPQVSVIIPAFGPPATTVAAVDNLLAIARTVHLEVIVVDNDPSRGLPPLLPRAPRLQVIEPGRNTGFAGAINRGIAASNGEFVLFHNADLVLDESYLPEAVACMRRHPNAGAVSGLCLRPAPPGEETPRLVDSAGIVMRRDRSAFDRGEGEPCDARFDREEEVFAVSGAALFARRAALDDVAVEGEWLPEAFFMYKEDIDLCWRLRLRGWECWYTPAALALHGRSSRGVGGRGYLAGARRYLANERAKPPHVRLHSLKNEWLMLVRNESAGSLLPDLPRVLWRQALLAGVTATISPILLGRAVVRFARALPAALRARRAIHARAVVAGGELRKAWFRP